MDPAVIIQYAAAAAAAGLAVYALFREQQSLVQRLYAAGMLLMAVEFVFGALSVAALMPEDMIRFQRCRLLVMSLVPAVWMTFSLAYARGNHREFLTRWRYVLAFAYVAPPALALASWGRLIEGAIPIEGSASWAMVLGPRGMALCALFIVGAAAVLMNLENTLRASTGTMRWRIKFMILGLGLYFAVRVFTLSQVLLYSSIDLRIEALKAGAMLVACVLMAKSLHRSDLMKVDLYLSHRLIFTSLTVMLVGAYLLIVGLMAQVASRAGGAAAFTVKAFVVFVAVILLLVLLMSDRARLLSKRFVSRHFNRPLHDYRGTWTAFTHRTASLTEQGTFSREVARFVSETFDTLSVTVWLIDETREAMEFGASTSMSDADGRAVVGGTRMSASLMALLRSQELPIDLDQSRAEWIDALKACNPDFFGKGGTRLCMPLVASNELLGLMIMGDRVSGLAHSVEDIDLYKTLCDQAAAKLLTIRLSERLLQAKEVEAFQTMSAFFVHDLKNTASTLSLMLQNLPRHFEDPAFREDALRAMGKSVTKINDVIRRLTMLRQKLEVHPRETDLNEWVRGVLADIEGAGRREIAQELGPMPAVRIDPELMNTVMTNLVINAREAVRGGGRVSVRTEARDGWAVVSVVDTGCGIPPDFLQRDLFRPFRTTRKEGMGIGLFHSRMIVDAHRGRLEVESEPGKGSTFRVLLPLGAGKTN
ncbi:MAG TPA: XrtA/PEP-CTERM system histidine kinase PrsK [Kiritimatiellia bacterium]|jgi:putative PEP-CTERM system histidine kinase